MASVRRVTGSSGSFLLVLSLRSGAGAGSVQDLRHDLLHVVVDLVVGGRRRGLRRGLGRRRQLERLVQLLQPRRHRQLGQLLLQLHVVPLRGHQPTLLPAHYITVHSTQLHRQTTYLERHEVELYAPLGALVPALALELCDPVRHRLHYFITFYPEVGLDHL